MERQPQKALPLVSVEQQEQIDALIQRIEEQIREATIPYVGRSSKQKRMTLSLGIAHTVEVEFTIKGDDDDE